MFDGNELVIDLRRGKKNGFPKKYGQKTNNKPFFKEVILWALVEFKKLSKYSLSDGLRFKDVYGGYISGL